MSVISSKSIAINPLGSFNESAFFVEKVPEAVKHGKESVTYFLQGITRTGKKSSEVIMCFRFNDGKFLKVF